MKTILEYPAKDHDAYERGDVCYIDEQSMAYTRADFLAACNGDEQVARSLFDLCYWPSPSVQFALFDESISLPELSHSSQSPIHWLIFQENPTVRQQALLEQSGWRAQDQRTWIIEQEACRVPTGIAFRDIGIRDLRRSVAESTRKHLVEQENLTEGAKVRRKQFENKVDADLARMAGITCYWVEQLPEQMSAWNSLEHTNGRGLRALFRSSLLESVEALWQMLDSLPANCEFVVTELKNLRGVAQIKANMRGGRIIAARSREMDSTLIAVWSLVSDRLNQEPLRHRLLRRWDKSYEIREEQIDMEKHRLERLPLHRRLCTDLFQDWEAETVGPAKTILTFLGWQSAYAFALGTVAFLPDMILPEMAQAFLADLRETQKEVSTALAKTDPESIWHEIEEGRSHAFARLVQEAAAFLSPEQGEPPPVIVYEYDLGLYGGNYKGVGDFVSVPASLIEQLGDKELAFEHFTGFSRCHIICYSNDQEAYDEEHSGQILAQISPQTRLAHYAICSPCQNLVKEQRQRDR